MSTDCLPPGGVSTYTKGMTQPSVWQYWSPLDYQGEQLTVRADQILREAADLIAQGWTQYATVRNARDEALSDDARQPDIAAWSLAGAVEWVAQLHDGLDSDWELVGSDALLALGDTLTQRGELPNLAWAEQPKFQRVMDQLLELLPQWNDAPGREAAEVIALLHEAADRYQRLPR
jgi:hypothetical protein